MKARRILLRFVPVFAACAVLGGAPLALAAGTELVGDYSGSYTAKTDSPFVVGATAPGSVGVTSLKKGRAAKVVIEGTNADKTTPSRPSR